MALTASRGCADFGTYRLAIKTAETMESFNDPEFLKMIGCPSEDATQLLRWLQTEGEPAPAV